jgi:hypothetical protein
VNRRQVLTGMALASAAVAVPTVALAEPRPDRRAWDQAFANLQAANKASDDFDGPIDAVSEAFEAGCAAIPHASFTSEDTHAFRRTLSTASQFDLAEARRFLASKIHGADDPGLQPYADICRKIINADDARKEAIEQNDQRLGYSKAHAHYDALSAALSAAEAALLNMPAPDGEALLWKVNRLYAEGEGIWAAGFESQTHADLRRLLSNGRARS